MAEQVIEEEHLDVLTKTGQKTGISRPSVLNDGKFINNEYRGVYLVTTIDPIPLEAFTLQESEVSAVKYIHFEQYRSLLVKEDPQYVPYDVNDEYGQLFEILSKRYKQNAETRALSLEKQLNRYTCVSLGTEFKKIQMYEKYPKGQARITWKHIEQLLPAENYQNYPPNEPNYVNIESPPSMHPCKRICDLIGI